MAIVIAPCLIAGLTPSSADSPAAPPPIGAAVWADTLVTVGNAASTTLKNLFTGQALSLEDSRLPVATALADFPVALLANF